MGRARWGAVAASGMVGLVLAGCGSSGGGAVDTGASAPAGATASSAPATAGGPANATVIAAAYRKTIAARTARMAINETVQESASGATRTVAATGDGVGDMTGHTLAATLTTNGQTLRILMVNYIEYMQGPALATELPAGKSWVRLDLNALVTAQYGASLSALQGSGSSGGGSMTQSLRYLSAPAGPPRRLGVDSIHGTASTHYAVVVDLAKAAAGLPPAESQAIQTLIGQLGRSTMPLDVWIDDQGRIDQVMEKVSLKVSGVAADLEATVTYYDFGTALPDMTPPPASQVEDITQRVLKARHS